MADAGKKTILLVEDEAVVSLFQTRLLESAGYRVIAALTGERALEVVRTAEPIDLVLMDIDLGSGLDGVETARLILGACDLPLVFLSSHTDPAVVARTEGIDSCGYIHKNSGAAVILASVRMALQQHRSRPCGQADAARLASEQQLQLVADNLPAFVAFVTLDDLVYRFVNRHYAENFGLPREQIIGRHIREIISETNYQYALPYIEEARQGRPARYETTFDMQQGKRWIEVSYVPQLDARGRAFAVVVLSYDTSERHRHEESLLVKDWAIDSSINAIAISDLDGILTYVNPAFVRLWGCGEGGAAVGRRVGEFWRSAEHAAAVVAALHETGAWQGEMDGLRADGTVFPVELSANLVVDRQGKPVCLMAAFVDITRRKADGQRIADLLAEKDLLLKETNHRIKNNLTSIAGLLGLQASAQTSPALRSVLQDAAERVLNLVTFYGALSRVEDTGSLSVREFLEPLICQVAGLFEASARVRVLLDIADVRIDVGRLTTIAIIINELITNAMKYAFVGRPNGLIRISIGEEARRLLIHFQDDGVGLPPGVGPGSSHGFGLQLLGMLVGQIDGTVSLEHGAGTGFHISCGL